MKIASIGEIEKQSKYKFMMIMAGLIITFNLCSGIMGPIVITLGPSSFHFSVTCGVLPFCAAFFLMDIFTNHYGADYAKQLSTVIAVCNLTLAIVLYLLLKLPAVHISNAVLSYQQSFEPMIKSFFAGSMAAFAAFYVNSIIFSKLFFYFQGNHLWLRCIGATSLGELIYSAVFDGAYFSHILSIGQIIKIVIDNYGFKFIFEVTTLPLTYVCVYFLSKIESNIPAKFNTFQLRY